MFLQIWPPHFIFTFRRILIPNHWQEVNAIILWYITFVFPKAVNTEATEKYEKVCREKGARWIRRFLRLFFHFSLTYRAILAYTDKYICRRVLEFITMLWQKFVDFRMFFIVFLKFFVVVLSSNFISVYWVKKPGFICYQQYYSLLKFRWCFRDFIQFIKIEGNVFKIHYNREDGRCGIVAKRLLFI